MAGENPGETPDGNQGAEIIGLLRGIKSTLDGLSATVERYGPALDKAAALVDSPAARLAGRMSWRRPG